MIIKAHFKENTEGTFSLPTERSNEEASLISNTTSASSLLEKTDSCDHAAPQILTGWREHGRSLISKLSSRNALTAE